MKPMVDITQKHRTNFFSACSFSSSPRKVSVAPTCRDPSQDPRPQSDSIIGYLMVIHMGISMVNGD